MCLLLAVPGPHCCMGFFSRCGAQVSHCGGFSCCTAQALGAWASVVHSQRLHSATRGALLMPDLRCPLDTGVELSMGRWVSESEAPGRSGG